MRINPSISDLFFNQDFSECENERKVKNEFNGYNYRLLLGKASNVLVTLQDLGLSNLPDRKEVVRDFFRRV